jgi:type II secretory pathway component PulM
MSAMSALPDRARIGRLWQERAPRERALIVLALIALAALALWHTTVAPAWRLWSRPAALVQAPEQALAQMRQLQAQAQTLRQQPRMNTAQSRQAISQSAQALGARLSGEQGRSLLIELPATSAAAVFGWLETLGPQTGARVVQASLQQAEPGLWSGRITLELP